MLRSLIGVGGGVSVGVDRSGISVGIGGGGISVEINGGGVIMMVVVVMKIKFPQYHLDNNHHFRH